MLIAVSLLVISLTAFLYHRPPSVWSACAWLRRLPASHPPPPPGARQKHDENNSKVKDGGHEKRNIDTTGLPTFTLAQQGGSSDDDSDNNSGEDGSLPPPQFPALNSAQRASAPAKGTLMPPPTIKPSNLRALAAPTSATTLRVPTTGPLPNRGPVPSRTPRASSGTNPSTEPGRTTNARGKVLLSPGHSPLDWANLQRSGENLSGVPSLIRVTPSMLKHNNGRKGKPAWSSYQGKVYNITPYLPFHPGGEGELMRAAGKDGGKLFMEVHPWVNWENMLGECLVGIAVSEDQEQRSLADGQNLDEMD
ncbi:uncharacterized protein EI97DRAFT_433715 [Westerdykella ornata]|uniref:Cytochrome b5 heme-binding domain-containing protein n=1 Tax=Westerdykella ornata TaxID=318751 RepID=A0A6A6JGJ4_WESOR|nr:uncharacterized protein EI97DRAFT_433715 [Westerdykella ornata]KAF2275770.1 hypothetical protein EI97DRAFT_433715 [Westerdykella ornata]